MGIGYSLRYNIDLYGSLLQDMDKLTDVFCHFGEDVGKHVEKAPKTGAQKNKPIAYYLRCCNFKASVAKFGHDAKGLALKKTI